MTVSGSHVTQEPQAFTERLSHPQGHCNQGHTAQRGRETGLESYHSLGDAGLDRALAPAPERMGTGTELSPQLQTVRLCRDQRVPAGSAAAPPVAQEADNNLMGVPAGAPLGLGRPQRAASRGPASVSPWGCNASGPHPT